MYKFTPPTIMEGPLGPDRLSQFYQMPRGISILKFNNKYIEVRMPTQDDIANAEEVYLGGYVYEVGNDVAEALIAAGYEDNLTEI